jgi:hypothetical protein
VSARPPSSSGGVLTQQRGRTRPPRWKRKHAAGGVSESARRGWRETNRLDDIPGTEPGTRSGALRTTRMTNPNARDYSWDSGRPASPPRGAALAQYAEKVRALLHSRCCRSNITCGRSLNLICFDSIGFDDYLN